MPKYSPKQQMIAQRCVARRLAMIAIYQWQITEHDFTQIYKDFRNDQELSSDLAKCDPAYFKGLVTCVMENTDHLDEHLNKYLDRSIRYVDDIERAILRMATCELLNHLDVPYKVIVNESVNLTKKFGAEQAFRYVNGVLDKLAADIRRAEIPT